MKKRYKPYKKTYRANEKVYVLAYYESFDKSIFIMRLCKNTVRSVHKRPGYTNYPLIELKRNNNAISSFIHYDWLAPRTIAGKNFLQKRARAIVNSKIGILSLKKNQYLKELNNCK